MGFKGFTSQEQFIPLPESFLREVLPALSSVEGVKAALYAFWRLIMLKGTAPALPEKAFLDETALTTSGLDAASMRRGLDEAAAAGVLLVLKTSSGTVYLLNTPQGRALQTAFEHGEWQPQTDNVPPPPVLHPNIYRIYEENIGPLTPLIADALRDAEKEYSPEWVAEALGEAVKRNSRNWKYAEAILKRWKEEGHAHQKTQRDSAENRFRYLTGKFARYVKK